MSKPKAKRYVKPRPTKGHGLFSLFSLLKSSGQLMLLSLIPLAMLFLAVQMHETQLTQNELVASSQVSATPLASLPLVEPNQLDQDTQETQVTVSQPNDPVLNLPNSNDELANISTPSAPMDESQDNLNTTSDTPAFIEELIAEQEARVRPFDEAGQVTQAQAVGQSSLGVSPTDFGFTGQRQENFGLMDYGGRFYSPTLGRFISADPIVPNYTNPQALNRYSYVYNNPVNYTDPTGHCTEWEGSPDGLCTRARADGSLSGVVRGGSVFVNYVEKNYANAILSGNPEYMNQIPTDTPGMFLAQSFQNVETQLGYRAGGMPIDPYVAIGMSVPFGSLAEDGISSGSQMPSGFRNPDEFQQFGSSLYAGLKSAGIDDATAIFQGSSVTGKKFTTGQAFDVGRVSDFDIGLASPTLLQRAGELGIGLRSGGTRTGPLKPLEVERLGLTGLSQQLSEQAGRPVNFMIYNSVETAVNRGPSIVVRP